MNGPDIDHGIDDATREALNGIKPRDLGEFRAGFTSIRRTIALSKDRGFEVFCLKAREVAGFVEHGLDRQVAVDELVQIAQAYGLGDVEVEIAQAFEQAEREPEVFEAAADHRPKANSEDAPPLQFLDMAAWDGEPVPAREWLVRDRIPARQPFLLTGAGGVGKSILTMQLAAAVALGRDWLGTMPEAGPVIYLAAEDEAAELHRRMASIAGHYGVSLRALHDLHMTSFAGEEATLGAPDRAGIIRATPLLDRLRKAAHSIRPKLIVLDTVSDIFAGNESDRAQVAAFVKLLQNMAMASDAAVIVNAHPSLSGIATGRGTSGSTGWHDKFRGRAYFKPAKISDDDAAVETDLRELQFLKNNFGPTADSIAIRWHGGVFVPVQGSGTFDRLAEDEHAEAVFMALLTRFNRENRNVSYKPSATYAPTQFALEAEAKGIGSKVLGMAMRRLFAARKIHVAIDGPEF